jgi:cytochrome c556
MNLFEQEDPTIAELKAQIAALQARLDGPPQKSLREEKQGFSPKDAPRTWKEWQQLKKTQGKAWFQNSKVQAKVLQDANTLGRDAFYNGDASYYE